MLKREGNRDVLIIFNLFFRNGNCSGAITNCHDMACRLIDINFVSTERRYFTVGKYLNRCCNVDLITLWSQVQETRL